MSQKLTMVVTCTDRKSLQVDEERMLRSLPRPSSVSVWMNRIEATDRRVPLRRLYQGDSWSQLPRLEEAARASGFEPSIYVASAGLGLRPISADGPAYSATFTPNQPDSIHGSVTQQTKWWDELNEWNGSRGSLPNVPTLFVLSRRYADVLAPLVVKSAIANPVLVVGGSDAVPSSLRLPADAKLRSTLGGTLGALNMRAAVAWMNRLTSTAIDSQEDREAWNVWSQSVGKREAYDRDPLRDDEVIEAIRLVRVEEPRISKTRALRALRDSGFACEQRRFGRLFESARGGAS